MSIDYIRKTIVQLRQAKLTIDFFFDVSSQDKLDEDHDAQEPIEASKWG